MARMRADAARVSGRKIMYLAAVWRCWATLSAIRRRDSVLCSSLVARKVVRGGGRVSSCSWVVRGSIEVVVVSLFGERDTFSWLWLGVVAKTGRSESGVFVVVAELDREWRSSREEEICRFARRDERKAGGRLLLELGCHRAMSRMESHQFV